MLSFIHPNVPMACPRLIAILMIVALASPILEYDDAEAKRKKRRYSPPSLKILDISTSPMPFAPGTGSLSITVDVGLPKNLSNVDVLEVSSLISFPSRRSIRFLYNRLPIEDIVASDGKPKVTTTLLWDGKDQTQEFVTAGKYKYLIRAKLMSNREGPARTKVVSLRARGELEVSAPETVLNREPHSEHVPFTSDAMPAEELPAEELVDESDDVMTSEDDALENEEVEDPEDQLQEVVSGEVSPPVFSTGSQ